MQDVTIVTITKDEEKNLAFCLESVKGFAKRCVVVDSGSTDRTKEIAIKYGADFYENPFVNYATQFNWGLDNTDITSKWVVRLDADERFTPKLCAELEQQMSKHEKDDVNGFVLEARLFFMDKELKHGGSRKKKLMVFKNGFGRIENRKMDEHTVLSEGKAIEIKEPFLHYDFKDLTSYVKKLNWYATREMQDYIEGLFPKEGFNASDKEIAQMRSLKTRYYKAPMFWRCWAYFIFAYLIKGNCRNGKEGFIYSFLYHLYYRLLVDAKIYEQKKYNREFEVTGDLK